MRQWWVSSPLWSPLVLRTLAVLLPLLLLAPVAVHADSSAAGHELGAWELEDRDASAGWSLYTRPEPGSDFLRYRMVSHSDEPIERVIAALRLKSREDRYLPKGQVRRVIAHGDDFFVSHLQIEAPIIADRDAVLRLRWHTDPETGVHLVEWGQPSGAVPPVSDGYVRIVSQGFWQITPLAAGGTEMVYESHSELGSVPAWLVSRMMNNQIINEMLTLQQILEGDLPDVAASPNALD
jgi:hypothetical protein